MCDLPTLILLIAASALALARHRKSKQQRAAAIAPRQAITPGPSATAAEIEAFFAVPANYRERHVDHIVAAIGPWSSYEDWDRGQWTYEWLRLGLRIRVETNSGYVRCVELLDPSDTSRVGTVIKALYQREELSDG
jgi:hypothetical protein